MEQIDGILFEPVGCLAEFPVDPFLEIASLLSSKSHHSKSASRAYWHALNLMESHGSTPQFESLEIQAVEAATIFEDVAPALAGLRNMGVTLSIASSLCAAAVARFVEISGESFNAVSSRDSAGGIKARPIEHALHSSGLSPTRTMVLTDTAEGMKAAATTGVHAVLMMNDPDEARRLAMRNPFGGVVSLVELPNFLALLRSRSSGI